MPNRVVVYWIGTTQDFDYADIHSYAANQNYAGIQYYTANYVLD